MVIQAYRRLLRNNYRKLCCTLGLAHPGWSSTANCPSNTHVLRLPGWVSLTHAPVQSVIASHSHTLSHGLGMV